MNIKASIPDPARILGVWEPFRKVIGVTVVRNRRDHARALATIEVLLDEIGEDESHPLAEVLDFLAERVRAWEERNTTIPEAEPLEMLRLLMEQNGLRQSDLADCAPQGRISEILNGQRAISKALARQFGQRFGVSPALFL